MEKTLNVTNTEEVEKKVSEVEVFGNPDRWVLICKASSKTEGWMKSTKAMQLPSGCLVQASTQQAEQVAEAITFVPGIKLTDLTN